MKTPYDRERTLDLAQKNSEEYVRNVPPVYSAVTGGANDEKDSIVAANSGQNTCDFCGNNRHPRKTCPAREAFCNKCEKKGHLAKVCLSKRGAVSDAMHQANDNASQPPFLAAVTDGVPSSLPHAIENIFIKNTKTLFRVRLLQN